VLPSIGWYYCDFWYLHILCCGTAQPQVLELSIGWFSDQQGGGVSLPRLGESLTVRQGRSDTKGIKRKANRSGSLAARRRMRSNVKG
jgi:hypothetical protein